jgi:putative high-molecular-weight surface-exposed protein
MFALPDSDSNSLIWDRKDSLMGLNYDLDIVGGYSDLSAVSNNTLDFRDYCDPVHFLYVGYSERQVAIYNTLNISGGKIKQAVYGGRGLVAAEGNKILISGGVFEGPEIYGGRSFRNDAADNIVDIDKGAKFKQSAQIYGGHSIGGNVEYNVVSIRKESGIKDGSRIVGGESQEGSAKGNEVDVDADALEAKIGIYGGISNEGEAKANKVTINGGIFKEPQIIAGESTKGSAAGNTLNLNGGTFEGPADMFAGKSRDGSTVNNIVNLNSRGLDLSGIKIWGGFTSDTAQDYFTGNTINVREKNIKASAIYNFEFLNFYIPVGFAPATDKMLALEHAPNLAKSKIGVGMMNGGVLNGGDKLTLIEATNGDITYPTDMSNQTGQLQAGISALYQFKLKKGDGADKKLFAVVKNDERGGPFLLPYPKNILETTIGELGVLLSSSDLTSSMSLQTDSNGVFASTIASSTRLKSGSHVDLKSFNAAVGLAKEFEENKAGAFVEFGGGKYDSFNDFDKIDVRGSGKFKYMGLGIITKFNLPNSFYISRL